MFLIELFFKVALALYTYTKGKVFWCLLPCAAHLLSARSWPTQVVAVR